MRKRALCTLTGLLLATSLAMTGCSFSIKLGDKEITNQKETTVAKETEAETEKETEGKKQGEEEETVGTHVLMETKSEEETTARETEAVADISGRHQVRYNGGTLYYGGEDYHLEPSSNGSVQYLQGDNFFIVSEMDEETVAQMFFAGAIIDGVDLLRPYGITDSDVDEMMTMLANSGMSKFENTKIYYDKPDGLPYFMSVDINYNNTDAYLVVYASDSSQGSFGIIYTKGINIPVDSFAYDDGSSVKDMVSGTCYTGKDIMKMFIDSGELDDIINGVSGDSSGSGTITSGSSDDDGTAVISGNKATFKTSDNNSVTITIPSGYKVNYSSDTCITMGKEDNFFDEIEVWGYEFYAGDSYHKVSGSSTSYEVYSRDSEFDDNFLFVIKDDLYIDISFDKDNHCTLSDAEKLLKEVLG